MIPFTQFIKRNKRARIRIGGVYGRMGKREAKQAITGNSRN